MCERELQKQLIEWYDTHARALPWRVPPEDGAKGTKADPYHVWLSEIMLQQTTVGAVKPYFQAFTTRWPRVQNLAATESEAVMTAWAGLGYYARARNLLKCAQVVVRDHDGQFPGLEAELLKLPGIGPYTAAAIAAIAFDQRAVVVDGNVERVMARFHDIRAPLPGSKPQLKALAAALTPDHRPGDHAQAVMDLGATICTPRNPACGICPWREPCAGRKAGSAADLPAKTPKAAKPVRRGIAYLARREDEALLLETRPDKGLLGGTLGLPGSEWQVEPPVPCPPITADWAEAPVRVRHTFTHFHLDLTVMMASVPVGAKPDRGSFRQKGSIDATDLPTVFAKALRAGLDGLGPLG